MSDRQFEPLGPHDLYDDLAVDQPGGAELDEALAIGRQLESISRQQPMRPSAGFEDRVWATISAEPLPAPATAAGHALRRRKPGALLRAVVDARRVALGGARPWRARGRAVALLLAAALILGSLGAVAAAGAINLLAPAPAPAVVPSPSVTPAPSPSPSPVQPSPSPSAAASGEESPEPDDSPEPSDEPHASGTGEPHGTEEPDGTEEPSGTPKASQTPKPSETSGSGD